MPKQIVDISVPDAETIAIENKLFDEKMAELEAFSLQTKLLLEKFHTMLCGESV
ncbi:hypothetical protein W01_05450 [Candidatus Nitrotoga sp. AM1P]|nr:hypothetical protein W01_05450 [Candidatus Nitrotoga sp. AM1P]